MKVTIMSAGEQVLTDCLSNNSLTRINSFKISGSADVDVSNVDKTAPTGAVLYTGGFSQVRWSRVGQSELTFYIYLDHTLGDFRVGNIMLFLDPTTVGGLPVPFLWATLPQASMKNDSDLPNYVIGNRIIIQIGVWFPYIVNALDTRPMREMIAYARNYANETVLPSVETSDLDQAVLDRHTNTDNAVLAVKDTANTLWWASPFTQFIEDSSIGVMSGGIAGQPFGSPSNIQYFDGALYKTDTRNYTVVNGGDNWATPTEPPLNGGSYLDT